MKHKIFLASIFVFLLAAMFAIAEEHYTCTQTGDLDQWNVPTWKQDSLFDMGFKMYIDVYDNDTTVITVNNDNPVLNDCIGRPATGANSCTESCWARPCSGDCMCHDLAQPSDGTGTYVNKIVDDIIDPY